MTYHFETIWKLEAPIEKVFGAIADPKAWSTWWPNIKAVTKLQKGDEQGVGAISRYEFSTQLPYTLAFEMKATQVQRPYLLEGRASGELEGLGRWTLEQKGTITVVYYLWEVSTTKTWMNVLSPLLKPAFTWNHHQVMKKGGQRLAKYLGVRLVEEYSLEQQKREQATRSI
jgi:uncharacterized protein YndB with AHSA1/START domain